MISVLHVFRRMDRGGAEMRTLELMPLLAEKGVKFSFCTLAGGKGQLDQKVHELGGEILPCLLRPHIWSFGRRFVRLLQQSHCNIVHSHTHYFGGYVVYLAAKAGIKGRIVHFRNTADGKADTLVRRLYWRSMHKLANRYATSILAVCRGAMEFAWGQHWQKDSRARVIYNGLDLSPYRRRADERKSVLLELGLPSESKLVINVGHLHRQKGHDVLLDATAKVIAADPAFHLLLVGDGVLRAEMEAKVKTLDITGNVHFLGVRGDVPRLLKASDCFVLSSRWEGLPGAVLEAVAAHLPVVATDLPGVREIAEHTDLISLVQAGDRDAICERILKTTKELGSQPREKRPFPGEFDLHHCAEQVFEVYLRQLD